MPGIVGLITKMPREWAEPQLLRMVESLRHEKFYVTATWMDPDLGVYVGSVERKGSFAERMPVRNEGGDVQLFFSGEEFPEPESAQRLREKGHTIEPGAASYLAHVFEEDPKFPANLNGRFHGLLADRRRGTSLLFVDRYGLQRLYYHQAKEAFYFAAESKAILAVRPELRKADMQGVGEFVACGCVLDNRTLFEGIRVLPAGSSWTFRNGALEKKGAYFESREWEELPTLDPEAYYQQLREAFSRNLPRYFGGDQLVGISLTGGLDSRMIFAWHKAAPGSLPCYSFGGMFRDSQDVSLSRRVAAARQQPYQVIPVGKEFLSQFSRYAERTVYLSDGCVDVSHSPDLYVNERAREIAPVRMTGNYGGEVLRRVRAFKPVRPIEGLFRPEILRHVESAGKTYASLIGGHPLSFAVFRQAPWHHYGLLSLEQTQVSLRSPYLDNRFVQTVFQAPASACINNDVCLRLIGDGDPAMLKIPTDRGLAGTKTGLAAKLSREYLEFTFKSEYAYDYGMPQWVAQVDHLFSPLHLERLFLGRHKFYHFRYWYSGALSEYVKSVLLDSRTLSRPYLERRRLEEIVNAHTSGNRNYTTAIHKVLTLEHVHRLFLD